MAGYGDRADPSIRTGSILPSTRARNRMKLTAGIGTSRHRPEARSMLSARRPRRRRLRRRAPDPPPTERFRATRRQPGRSRLPPSGVIANSYLVDPALLVSGEIRGPFLREKCHCGVGDIRHPVCVTATPLLAFGRSHSIAPSIPAREHRRDAVRRRTRRPMQPRRQARRRLRPRRRG
jgi:hypothetical protein